MLQEGERKRENTRRVSIMEKPADLQEKKEQQEGQKYTSEYETKALKLKYRRVLHTKETMDLRFCAWVSNSEKERNKKKIWHRWSLSVGV